MSIRIVCPEGHSVAVEPSKLGQTAICPRCFTAFRASLDCQPDCHARKEAGKADDDADDEIEVHIQEGPPQRKANPKKAKQGDEEIEVKVEDDEPQKKASPKNAKQNADDEDEDIEVHVQEKQPAKKASAKKSADDDKPRAAKPARKKQDDDDEEDDDRPRRARADDQDDEDNEEEAREAGPDEDDEPPIEWTKKKRQMSTANVGLVAYVVSIYVMLVMFVLVSLMAVVLSIALVIAFFTESTTFAELVVVAMIITGGVFFIPIYICHLVAWITGVFSPPKCGGRGVCITALCLFFSPIFLYLVWLLFKYAIIERPDVSWNLFIMVSFVTFLLMKIAFYCSLIYIGRIASFMRVADDRKPQALGWFIVGGSLIMSVSIVLVPWVPFLIAKIIVIVFNFNCFYFVISSLAELIGIVNKTRAAIADFIKNK